MNHTRSKASSPILDLAPHWLQRFGVNAWLVVGVAAALWIAGWVYRAVLGIAIPLIIAIVIGVAVAPLVALMERKRIPRSVGAVLTLLLLILVIVAAVVIVVRGLVAQGPQVMAELSAGVQALGQWLAGLGVSEQQLQAVKTAVEKALPSIAQGLSAAVTSGISGVVTFIFGIFIGAVMLYYILKDMPLLTRWIGAHVGLRPDLGCDIVEDGARSIRDYFKGATVVALVNTAAIVAGLLIFGVPLVGPIAIVTFILAYIPYFGALISGAFAVLVALGSGGATDAIAILVIVLLAQNVLQQPVSAWAVGAALELHPLVVLLSTLLGGIVMGIVGATLGAPLTAMAVRATNRLRAERERLDAVAPAAPIPEVSTGVDAGP